MSIHTALLIVDVQNDFIEGGKLAVKGGSQVALGINEMLKYGDYPMVLASRDWHDPDSDNGGHFSVFPDYVDTWPVHCVAGTEGAEYAYDLDVSRIDAHIRKGQGKPAYSAFEGTVGAYVKPTNLLTGVGMLDVVGIATDYCVQQTVLDALNLGIPTTVLTKYCAGVSKDTSEAAIEHMRDLGAIIV